MKINPSRWQVLYRRPIAYEIVCTPDLFDPDNDALLAPGKTENARRFVVVDANVERHWARELRAYFESRRIDARIVSFPGGEENKTLESYLAIMAELDAFPIHRRDEPIIAIGGGVLTDVVGFVAGSYRRGVPHVKVPTTLMGYVDASVGIKTGLNFNGHKNRLGSFEAPLKVLLDRRFLKTLPRRHILNGLCEIVKLAVIRDRHLFDLLELHGVACVESHFMDEWGCAILDCAISGMLAELQPNLFEEDLCRRVDFGHTFSYGLETCPEAHLLHGEAVLLDIAVSVLIARARGLLSDQETARIFSLFERLGITPQTDNLDAAVLWQSLQERVEHRNGLQRVPMPAGIGNCVFLNDIRPDEIESAIKTSKEWVLINNDQGYER